MIKLVHILNSKRTVTCLHLSVALKWWLPNTVFTYYYGIYCSLYVNIYFAFIQIDCFLTFSACDHVIVSRCFTCNSALNMLIDAFTRSVQTFLSGERHEPSLRTANVHANLTKGLSKVCIALYIYR